MKNFTLPPVAKVGIALIAITIAGGGLFSSVSAEAHDIGVTGTSSCDTATGTYTVDWVFDTTDVPAGVTDTISISSYAPSGTGPASISVVGNTSAHVTQTGIAGTATSASITSSSHWSDGYSTNAGAGVRLAGNCVVPPPVVPTKPAPTITHAPVTTTDCGTSVDTTVDTVTTTDWVIDTATNTWVPAAPVVSTATTTAPTTAAECASASTPPAEPVSKSAVASQTVAAPTPVALADTGSDTTNYGLIGLAASIILVIGVGLCVVAIARKRNGGSE